MREHPALASAKRAIRHAVSHLMPAQVLHVAAYIAQLETGEDRSRWALSASYMSNHPEFRWTCDDPKPTKKAVTR